MGDSEHHDLGSTMQGVVSPESLPPEERVSDKRTEAIEKLAAGITALSRETKLANRDSRRARYWALAGVAVNVLVAIVVLKVVDAVADEVFEQLAASAEKSAIDDSLRKRSLEANATLAVALQRSLKTTTADSVSEEVAAAVEAEELALQAEAQTVATMKLAEEGTVKKAKIDRKPAPPAAAAKVRVLNDRLESVKRKAKKRGIALGL